MHFVDKRFNVTGIPADKIKLESRESLCIHAQFDIPPGSALMRETLCGVFTSTSRDEEKRI
jgi:hypothetical protein